nr:kelch repeat-containing protein [uncultured Rhodoferax sp.]
MKLPRALDLVVIAVVLSCGYLFYLENAPVKASEPVGTDVLMSKLPGNLVSDPAESEASAGADVLLGRLPAAQGWRTFAKPLALENGAMMLFQRDGNRALVWHIDWKANTVRSFTLPELDLGTDNPARYTALASQHGVWLLGPTSVLIKPDGQRLSLKTGFNEPVAVVLNDQSVLALGHSASGSQGRALYGTGQGAPFHMQQLRLDANAKQLSMVDRGVLSFDGRPNQTGQTNQVPRYGHTAVKLQDGRVLLLGGDVTPTLASLIEPNNAVDTWVAKPVAPMPHERVNGAALVLPDGRVLVTGARSLGCYGESAKVRSVDVYEPQTNRWASLPGLPFVPCADAYGADAPSTALTPNGTIVVAGYLEPQVMVLPRNAKSPTGYAASWQVAGLMPLRRISGKVQALSDQDVVAAGGVDNQDGFGGCCFATSGFDRINIMPGDARQSIAFSLLGTAAAKRGKWLFAGGGRRFGFTSTGQMRYSALAELTDLTTGAVKQLPNIPFASGAAQAFWLDDARILFKGIKESNDRGFEMSGNLSSYIPPSSSAMAIYNVVDERWSEPIALPELEFAQLVQAEGNVALLLTAEQRLLRLDLDTRKLQMVSQLQRGRQGGLARLLADGMLVSAGGEVQSETVSALDPDCRPTAGQECPERYVGTGPYARVAIVERLALTGGKASAAPTLSATGPANEISTVITAQGRVIVLSQDPQTQQISIARSDADGSAWDSMALPSLAKTSESPCGRCALAVAADPRDATKELIFFRQGAIDADYVDDGIKKQTLEVWLWSEPDQAWIHVFSSKGLAARASPQALDAPLSPRPGKRMMSIGWHLSQPILWIDP